jgi:hypothetical protein
VPTAAPPASPPPSHFPPPTSQLTPPPPNAEIRYSRSCASPVTYSVGASFRMPPKKESGDSPKKVREAPHHPTPHPPPPPPPHTTRVASVPAQLSALQGKERKGCRRRRKQVPASPPPSPPTVHCHVPTLSRAAAMSGAEIDALKTRLSETRTRLEQVPSTRHAHNPTPLIFISASGLSGGPVDAAAACGAGARHLRGGVLPSRRKRHAAGAAEAF